MIVIILILFFLLRNRSVRLECGYYQQVSHWPTVPCSVRYGVFIDSPPRRKRIQRYIINGNEINCMFHSLSQFQCFYQKKVEPWKLYTMVSGLLAVDLVILLTWQLQDPLQRRLETFPLEDPLSMYDDVKIRPELEHCESHNNSVWLGE